MRIAFVLPDLSGGGAERTVLTLAGNMKRLRHDVFLVQITNRSDLAHHIPSDIPVFRLGVKSVRRGFWPLRKILSECRVDTVLSTHKHVAFLLEILRFFRLNSFKHFIRIPNTYSHEMKYFSYGKRLLWNWAVRWSHSRSDGVIGISQGVTNDFVEHFGCPKNGIKTILNPVYDESFPVLAGKLSGVSRLDSRTGFNVVAAGRLVHQKGYDVLLRGFARGLKTQDAHLFVLGDGPLRAVYTEMAKDLGVHNQVSSLGFVNNPLAYISKSSVFVLSSRFEGLGNVLIQALCLGIPVVSTNCCHGPSEILQEGLYGTLISVDDDVALGKSLRRCFEVGSKVVPAQIFQDNFCSIKRTDDYERYMKNAL